MKPAVALDLANTLSEEKRAQMSAVYQKAGSPQHSVVKLLFGSAPSPDSTVIVTGTFDAWAQTVQMKPVDRSELEASDAVSYDALSSSMASLSAEDNLSPPQVIHIADVEVTMIPGEKIFYKFIVDGVWQYDPSQPIAFDSDFNLNNIIVAPMPTSDSAVDVCDRIASTLDAQTEVPPVPESAPVLEIETLQIDEKPTIGGADQSQLEEVPSPGLEEPTLPPSVANTTGDQPQSGSLMMKYLGMALGGGWGNPGKAPQTQATETVEQFQDVAAEPVETTEPIPVAASENDTSESPVTTFVDAEVNFAVAKEQEETVEATEPSEEIIAVEETAVVIEAPTEQAEPIIIPDEPAAPAVIAEKLVPFVIQEKATDPNTPPTIIKGMMPMPEMASTKSLEGEEQRPKVVFARFGHGLLTAYFEKAV